MSESLSDKFKKKWLDLPPRSRTVIAIAVLFGSMVAIGSLFIKPHSKPRKQVEQPAVSNMLLPKPKDTTGEQLSAQNSATQKDVDRLKGDLEAAAKDSRALQARIDEMERERKQPANGVTSDMMKELMEMKGRLEAMERKGTAPGKAPALSDPLPVPTEGGKAGEEPPERAKDQEVSRIRVSGNAATTTVAQAKQESKPTPYLTAGSMFEAILLNGMDAPTNSVAQKNPMPAVMRIKTEALLPNQYSHDVKECFVLVSGFGILSSERAQLRTETLSCVREGGKTMEAKVDGYVVGEDGRVGARGRLVSKQGQKIAQALTAGVLSGFATALTPTQVPRLDLSTGGNNFISTQRATPQSILETGVAKGFSSSANMVSQFYLELAKEITPVVEIDAGRKLTVVLIKGVELK